MIRVLVVDDHPIIREGISALFDDQSDIDIVGEVGDGEEAIAKTAELAPDVVLMDIGLPTVDGLEATRIIKSQNPETKILVLTIHDEKEYVERLLRAGANGYMLKTSYGPQLVEAVRVVAMGGTVLDSEASKTVVRVLEEVGESTSTPDPTDIATRERQILLWMAKGLTTSEMAARLNLSERTVMARISRLLVRFNAKSRAAALAAAVRDGVIKPEDLQ